MIKIRADINEMEKIQATEKTNLGKTSNQHHGEFYQIFMEGKRPILYEHFWKIENTSTLIKQSVCQYLS